MRAEKRAVAGNSVLAAIAITTLKIAVGFTTGSLGILSEAAHSGLDLIAAIVTFFENSIAASDAWTFTAKAVHTCAQYAAIDFAIDVETGGATMTIDGIEVFVAGDDGRFTSVHAYWDDADLTFGQAGSTP